MYVWKHFFNIKHSIKFIYLFFPTETHLTKDGPIGHIICKGKYGSQLQERNATTTIFYLYYIHTNVVI